MVARLWGKLSGAAKSIVRYADPEQFDHEDGLNQFLALLRESPLQRLPVPDSFNRLDKWSNLKRTDRETVAELIVREEELFTELQQSLARARLDRMSPGQDFLPTRPAVRVDPPSTPSRSPMSGNRAGEERGRDLGTQTFPSAGPIHSTTTTASGDFFEDELRGYRLLRACRLSGHERQNVLVQTANSTSFHLVRRALRTLYNDETSERQQVGAKRIWWTDSFVGQDWYDEDDIEGPSDDLWWSDWAWSEWHQDDDGSPTYWTGEDWIEDWWQDAWYVEDEDLYPDETSADPEEAQLSEAFAIANEANRTLKEAREAVRKVRLARGYYAPESSSGKGKAKTGSKPSSPSSKGGSKTHHGPCFICGMSGHGYQQCPDRFAPKGKSFGVGKGAKGKSSFKGKGYGKGFSGKGSKSSKGKTYFLPGVSAQWDEHTSHGRAPTRAILDTGATENAIGIDALHDLVVHGHFQYTVCKEDLPTFRFGNGHRDQAVSRADLVGTSLGAISFYVLGGMAKATPPLIGARTLRGKHAVLSYQDGRIKFHDGDIDTVQAQQTSRSVQMQALQSGNLTIDLAEAPIYAMERTSTQEAPISISETDRLESQVLMMSTESSEHLPVGSCEQSLDVTSRLQCLAQRLRDLQVHRTLGHDHPGTNGMRRSKALWLSLLWGPQGGPPANEPVRHMGELRQVRTADALHVQGQEPWRETIDGARATSHSARAGGVAADSTTRPLHRADGQWEADGDQRKDAAAGGESDHGHQHDLHGLHEEDRATWSSRWQVGHPDHSGALGEDHCKGGGQVNGNVIKSKGDGCSGDPSLPGGGELRAEASSGESRGAGHRGNAQDRTAGTRGTTSQPGAASHWPDGGGGPSGSGQWSDHDPQRQREGDGAGLTISPADPDQEGSSREEGGRQGGLWDRIWVLRRTMERSRKACEKGVAPEAMAAYDNTTTSTTSTTNHDTDASSGPYPFDDGKPMMVTRHGTCEEAIAHAQVHRHGINSIKADDKTQSKKNIVWPGLAKKIATGVAVLGACATCPVQGLMGHLSQAPDFVEVACSPTSALTSRMEEMGYHCKRYNYLSGYDLDRKMGTKMLSLEFQTHPPRMSWISLPCTRLSTLQNLTPRSEEEWGKFERRQGQDLKRADEVAEAVELSLETRGDSDFAWEWPTGASKGWNSKAIRRLLRVMKKLGRPVYWCRFHGCAYGLEYKGIPIQKNWTVLTSNRSLWMSLQKKCPGHGDHAECRGPAAQASAYYPSKVVTAVTKAIVGSWNASEERADTSITKDIETYLVEIPETFEDKEEKNVMMVRKEEPEMFALSRNQFPKEAPSGRKLELVKQQMMRIHRSSGHSSFGNLQRLLRARKAPEWAVTLAGNLQCPDCIESRKPLLHPPASTTDTPKLFEIVGVDVFEYDRGEDKEKDKFLIWRDRASGFVMTDHLQTYKSRWEPTAQDVVNSFMKWLMTNPSPSWIISDAGPQFTSETFLDFCSRSGIGVMTAPAEAHWIMGAEEGCINILKSSVRRLLKEEPELTIAHAFALAAHGANHTIGPSGFSPFQWVRGGAPPQEELPSGLDPKKAFGGQLRLKEKARIAFEQEHAKYKLSRLNNALGRSPQSVKVGSLAMLWRQRIKPGKTTGHWIGPVRVLLQEGSTLWLAHGATLIRAKTNQCRECTRREELQATLQGVAIYRQAVTMDSLLKNFTGKHYTNVTGENPTSEQMMRDFAPTDVRLLHDPSKQKSDERKEKKKPPDKRETKPGKIPAKKTIKKKDDVSQAPGEEEKIGGPGEEQKKMVASTMTPRTQAMEAEGKPIPPMSLARPNKRPNLRAELSAPLLNATFPEDIMDLIRMMAGRNSLGPRTAEDWTLRMTSKIKSHRAQLLTPRHHLPKSSEPRQTRREGRLKNQGDPEWRRGKPLRVMVSRGTSMPLRLRSQRKSQFSS